MGLWINFTTLLSAKNQKQQKQSQSFIVITARSQAAGRLLYVFTWLVDQVDKLVNRKRACRQIEEIKNDRYFKSAKRLPHATLCKAVR